MFGGLFDMNAGTSFHQANLNFMQQQMAAKRQEEQWQTTMAREDNAMQRRVKDLQLAGLSPTLAAGGSGASAASAPIPITPQFNNQQQNPNDFIALISGVKNIELSDTQIGLNQANTLKSLAETKKVPSDILKNQSAAFRDAQTALNDEYERQLAKLTGTSIHPKSDIGAVTKETAGIYNKIKTQQDFDNQVAKQAQDQIKAKLDREHAIDSINYPKGKTYDKPVTPINIIKSKPATPQQRIKITNQ